MTKHNSEAVTFRRANDADVESIMQFNLKLAMETEQKTLEPNTIRQGVSSGLQQFPEAQYFVAEHEDQIVGQLMFTREWSDWRNGWMLWLQSVYVEQQFRNQGVFRDLLKLAQDTVSQDGRAIGIRLYVERENETAMAAYSRLGFRDAGYRILEIVPLDDRVR